MIDWLEYLIAFASWSRLDIPPVYGTGLRWRFALRPDEALLVLVRPWAFEPIWARREAIRTRYERLIAERDGPVVQWPDDEEMRRLLMGPGLEGMFPWAVEQSPVKWYRRSPCAHTPASLYSSEAALSYSP